jgi:hypothetical protein
MKKQMRKLRLSKETLRNISEQGLETAVGAISRYCPNTYDSECFETNCATCTTCVSNGSVTTSGAVSCC